MRVRAIRYVVAELGLAGRIVHDPEHPDAGKSRCTRTPCGTPSAPSCK
jgi:hypothetical protein